jgi:hypothetical protein
MSIRSTLITGRCLMQCDQCSAEVSELFGGSCDLCVERNHWDYQESSVF